MSNESLGPIKTFIAGFDEEGYNEFEHANHIAKRFNTDHHKVLVGGEDYIESMEELINYKDSPLSVPNEVPLYIMSKTLEKIHYCHLIWRGCRRNIWRVWKSIFIPL